MKTCFKCGRALPLGEFYRHPMMADGHLGKCKDCTRRDVRGNREVRADYYRAYDRKRRPRTRPVYTLPWSARHPQKRAAQYALGNAVRDGRIQREPCEVCGAKAHGHHPDYSQPLVVRWLCPVHHMAEHVRLRRTA